MTYEVTVKLGLRSLIKVGPEMAWRMQVSEKQAKESETATAVTVLSPRRRPTEQL